MVKSIEKRVVTGNPDPEHISTSHVERQNLTMRMGMRRFTRLTNAFSKKVENLGHAVSIHFMYYNFARPHKSLGKNVTPPKLGHVIRTSPGGHPATATRTLQSGTVN